LKLEFTNLDYVFHNVFNFSKVMLCMQISVLFLMMVIISGTSLIGINQAFADACETAVDGTWNDPNTWDFCGGGVPDNTGDSALLEAAHIVELNNDFVVGAVTVSEGATLTLNAKLTAEKLSVGQQNSNLFINCSGELIITTNEGASNTELLTNHGILETLQNVPFSNVGGTYRSSGTDIFGGTFSGNDIVPIPSICVVGGSLILIDTTALLLAGTQLTAAWMIPVIVAGIGFAIVIARKF